MYQLFLFGNVLLDSSYSITKSKEIVSRHGLERNGLGECSIEKLLEIEADARETCTFLASQTGGSALNTATVLTNLNVRNIIFFGAIGMDAVGEAVQKMLADINMKTCLQIVADCSTGTCICLIEDDNRCCYANIGASIRFEKRFLQENIKNILDEDIQRQQIFYIESFFITGNRFTICQYIFDEICKQSKIVAINLGATYLIEQYPLEMRYLAERSTILFGNRQEFLKIAHLFEQTDVKGVMQYLIEKSQNEKLIVCTNGGGDVEFSYKNSNGIHCGVVQSVALPIDQIIDTTGCGDAFVAGFFYDYLQGLEVEDCVKKGVEIASRKIRLIGGSII